MAGEPSGTVTKANIKISGLDGTAFIDFSSAGTLTPYTDRYLVISDSSDKVIKGWIKAAGTGETFGDEQVTNWINDPANSFETLTISVPNITQAINTTGNCIANAVFYPTPEALYKRSWIFTLNNGATPYYWYTGWTGWDFITTGMEYITNDRDTETCAVGVGSISTSTDFSLTDVILKPVLTPSTTGVTIVSEKGGSTYNWNHKDSDFTYNDSDGYTYIIYNPVTMLTFTARDRIYSRTAIRG